MDDNVDVSLASPSREHVYERMMKLIVYESPTPTIYRPTTRIYRTMSSAIERSRWTLRITSVP